MIWNVARSLAVEDAELKDFRRRCDRCGRPTTERTRTDAGDRIARCGPYHAGRCAELEAARSAR